MEKFVVRQKMYGEYITYSPSLYTLTFAILKNFKEFGKNIILDKLLGMKHTRLT